MTDLLLLYTRNRFNPGHMPIILVAIVGLILWSLFFEKNPKIPPADNNKNRKPFHD